MSTANSYKKIENITIKDELGNVLEIVLCKNDARVWRIEYLLNGILLRPMKMTGSNGALAQWQMIENLTKKTAEKTEGKLNISVHATKEV